MECIVPNCDRQRVAKGYCPTHWERDKKGRPLDAPIADKRRGTPNERFDRKWVVDPTTGCHIWQDHLIKGYGQFRVRRGFQVGAHVFSYVRTHGPVPDGLVLDHLCHPIDGTCPGGQDCLHRRCVNPDHLKPETRGDNARRCVPMHLRATRWAA